MSAAVTEPAATTHRDVAALLKEASAADHRAAESRAFITRLMGGELDLAAYTRYLAQLAYVYEALESRPDTDSDAPVFDPRLRRSAKISADLIALGASDWRDRWPALPATEGYARHLRALIASPDPLDDPARYLAHHYTRYLGDLSGGQAIAVLMERHYGATPAQLTVFDFGELGSVVHAKREYKARLTALDLSTPEVDALLDEVLRAFRLSAAIFDELDAVPGRA